MDGPIAVFLFLIGGVVGGFATKLFLTKGQISRSLYETTHAEKIIAQTKLERAELDNADLRKAAEETVAEVANLREKNAVLETETKNFTKLVEDQKEILHQKNIENSSSLRAIEGLNSEIQALREGAIAVESERDSFAQRIQQHKEDLERTQIQLKDQFENLANKIFDEKNTKFKTQTQESLFELLSPLKEKLTEFQKKVDDSFGEQAKQKFSLTEQIKRIVEVNERMTFQTENLTKALKGDSKTQGNWGEIILQRILEDSGLRRDEEYILQGENMGLKNSETGENLRPDVVIRLPDNKHIIVDSKVSLTSFEKFSSEADEINRQGFIKQFIASVRSHIIGLEQKKYQYAEKLGTPDFVLMFMPIEGAFILAIQQDQELQSFAWNRKIVIVCPSTLFATLRTIQSVWQLERQNQYSLDIANRGGAMYDKIVGFVEDIQRLGAQIKTVEKTYDGAFSKLSTGRGNILWQAEQLRELGAKASKRLPRELTNLEEIQESIASIDEIK